MSNPLTTRSALVMKPLALRDLVIGHETGELYSSFHAADGAMVDLTGLQAIAAAPDQAVFTALASVSATDSNLVLEGMSVSGSMLSSSVSMPDGEGTRQVPLTNRGLMRLSSTVTVSRGLAVLQDQQGRRHTVRLHEDTAPENTAPDSGALVLTVATRRDDASARETVVPRLHFVPISEARAPHNLILAMTVHKGVWASDVQRLLPPEHPIIQGILDMLAYLEHVTWTEDRHGWPWDRRQQGREWSRYQTTATLALQATRTALMSHASTTIDRIRLLRNLHFQLRRSIERAEQRMLKWMGATEAPDPYRTVAPIDAALAVPVSRRIGALAQEFQQIFSTYNLRDQRKDSRRAYAQLFLYPPVNRTGYETMVTQFTRLYDFVRVQHAGNPDLLSPDDVELVIRGGEAMPLSNPAGVVDELVRVCGWDPR